MIESLIVPLLFGILTLIVGIIVTLCVKSKVKRCSEVATVKIMDAYLLNNIRHIRYEWEIDGVHFEKVKESEVYEIGDTYTCYYNKNKPTESMTEADIKIQSICGKLLIAAGIVSIIINVLRIFVLLY